MKVTEIIALISEIIGSIFYLSTGIIALLTYLRAKKTVLQPIKTEVFKEQVKIFTQISSLLGCKGEMDLRELFGFEELINANSLKLLDDYASLFFNVKINRESRPYSKDKCPGSFIKKEFIEKNTVLVTQDTQFDDDSVLKNDTNIDDNKDIIWSEYKFGFIYVPIKTFKMLDSIDEINKSPFLTKISIMYLAEIKKTVHENIMMISDVLTSISQQLPEIYKSLESMRNGNCFWIHNAYNKTFIPLEPCIDKLIDHLREYFKVESLMN